MKTTNTKARAFVQALKPFKASNLSGVLENRFYIVYSYGWYPLFAYSFAEEKWFQNIDKYSVSTSRQTTQSNPGVKCISLSHDQMNDLIQGKAVVA